MSSHLSQDEAEVTAVVQKYIDAIALTRPSDMIEVFHPQALMAAQFGGRLAITAGKVGEMIVDYMSKLPPTFEHSPNFKGRVLSVKIHSDIAAVELAEDQLEGGDMKTFFLLNKTDGDWIVTAKATTNAA
ncbi:nuclear transport factor 2 family protein [Pseudomonas sp. Z1-14]|uniref:nuclear transport factor 2 family protein n=1 Tax=Pseudomonas sp. Z1-14 TaxID=2817409 RepID=UPI003DA98618